MEWLRKRKHVIAAGAILMILGLGIFLWPYLRGEPIDPQVAKVRDLGKKLFEEAQAKGEPPQGEQFAELRQEMEKLSPEQRREVFREMGGGRDMRARMQEQMDEFFEMPKEEQTAFLDKQIDRMEQFRSRMEDQENPRRNRNRGGRRSLDQEERENRMRRMLDRTTPKQRAQMTKFFTLLQKRREERGLPALNFPGGPRG